MWRMSVTKGDPQLKIITNATILHIELHRTNPSRLVVVNLKNAKLPRVNDNDTGRNVNFTLFF